MFSSVHLIWYVQQRAPYMRAPYMVCSAACTLYGMFSRRAPYLGAFLFLTELLALSLVNDLYKAPVVDGMKHRNNKPKKSGSQMNLAWKSDN
ncbi:hypothetical protein OS493_040299 [Desmophyllum pertusum]|uniref:Uncharacterized protein n=1 Tax=Desmophyllum pertusum TaxID=174260 RepID=A0A9W9ZUF5_9CNID|nr:hypothetical protein OS493_040299 [Desmophyllum pertusum]